MVFTLEGCLEGGSREGHKWPKNKEAPYEAGNCDPILQMKRVRLKRSSHLPKVRQPAVAELGIESGLSCP